jgi:translocation and assembly module TamB
VRNREFQIARGGRIEFMGGDEIDPRLDLTATREISGVVASVRIGGVLSEPELQLSSTPPMEDAEVLSLIVFNQPLSLLDTGQQVSLATRATALATGFVASQLTQSVGEALELDVFELQATAPGATGLAPVLTVGGQFGQLFVKLRQRFGPEAVSEAVLEYRFAEWLRLQTSFAERQSPARNLLQRIETGGVDLLFWFGY